MYKEYVQLATLILEDQKVSKSEADTLLKWFADNYDASKNVYLNRVFATLIRSYIDGVVDEQELDELFVVISESLDALDTNNVMTYKDAKEIEYSLNTGNVKFNMATGNNYLISYVDAAGKESDREIIYKVLKTKIDGNSYMTAVCLLRSAVRNFRLDRIRFIVDVETGKHVLTTR